MRYLPTTVRGTCTMFSNRRCSLHHHHHCHYHYYHYYQQLFPTKLFLLYATILIILTNTATRIEAIQQQDEAAPAASLPGIFSGLHNDDDPGGRRAASGFPEKEHPEAATNANDSNFFAQRLLRDSMANSRRRRKANSLQANDVQNEEESSSSSQVTVDVDDLVPDRSVRTNRHRYAEPRFPSRITIPAARKKPAPPQRLPPLAPQRIPPDSLLLPVRPVPKSIPSRIPGLTNRHDCDGADCLKNNDAVSLYIPTKNNTEGRRPPPLLLLSNKLVNNSNRRPQPDPAVAPPRLQTGMKVLGPEIWKSHKPIPLSVIGASYNSGSGSAGPRYQAGGSYSGLETKPAEAPIPPFAGGAELTDFIQPSDTSTQNTRSYGGNLPSTVKTGPAIAYYGSNRQLQQPLPAYGDRGALQPAPLVPQQSVGFGTYGSLPAQPPPRPVYSTYSVYSPGPTPPPYYRSETKSPSSASSEDNSHEKIIQGVGTLPSEQPINLDSANVDAYPPLELIPSTEEQQIPGSYPVKKLGYMPTREHRPPPNQSRLPPAPPAAAPVLDGYAEAEEEKSEGESATATTSGRQPKPNTPRTIPTTPPSATPVTRPLETRPEFSLESSQGIIKSKRISQATPLPTAAATTTRSLPTRYTVHVEFTYVTAPPTTTESTTTETTTTTTTSESSTYATQSSTEEEKVIFPASTSLPPVTSEESITYEGTTYSETSVISTTFELTSGTVPEEFGSTGPPGPPLRHESPSTFGSPSELPSLPTKGITPFPRFPSIQTTRKTTTAVVPPEEEERTVAPQEEVTVVTDGGSTTIVQPPKSPEYTIPSSGSIETTRTRPPISSYTRPTPRGMVPNRLRGKAHVVCKENGLQFRITTLFPFTGQIFAHERKCVPQCYFTFQEATVVNITMPYLECGIRNIGDHQAETQYHVQIIVVFQQKDNTSTVQSFLTQCLHQKIQYQKQVIPKRIEEALEELRLIPSKLEQKAPIPDCQMRIVTEEEHGHGDDGLEVNVVDLGQPMSIEWSLVPESDAYGFHVRNCTVRDMVSGDEYLVIDERGCSTDINIFGHPHYDTYHDIARVHWHAFKVPDTSQLSIKCTMEICTDIPDSVSGVSNCDSIPSPPFCPDLITSPTNELLLYNQETNVIRKRREHSRRPLQQHVHADICFGDSTDEYCNSESYQADHERHINMFSAPQRYCLSRLWLSIWTGLSAWTTLLAIGVHGCCRRSRRKQMGTVELTTMSKSSSSPSSITSPSTTTTTEATITVMLASSGQACSTSTSTDTNGIVIPNFITVNPSS